MVPSAGFHLAPALYFIAELTWKDIYDADACTACKRCQDRCPARATGKPLSAMKVVQLIGEAAFRAPGASLVETVGERIGSRISETRVAMAAATGAPVLVANCPFCLTMFEDGHKTGGFEGRVQAMDLAEIVAKRLASAGRRSAAGAHPA